MTKPTPEEPALTYQPPTTPETTPPQPAEQPMYATDLGVPPTPTRRKRSPLLAAGLATLIAVLVIFGGGYLVYTQFIREDSGVAACKAIRDGDKLAEGAGDDKLTEAEYREARKQFEDSDREKLREHGTALIDLVWQISQMPDGEEMGALAFLGPMGTHVSGLQTACADEGIIVDLTKN